MLLTSHGEAQEQVAQGICACPIPGNAQDKLRWVTEHLVLLSGAGTEWALKSFHSKPFYDSGSCISSLLKHSSITSSFTKSTSAFHLNHPPLSGTYDSRKPSLANKRVQGGTKYHTLFHNLLHQVPCFIQKGPTFSIAFSFLHF